MHVTPLRRLAARLLPKSSSRRRHHSTTPTAADVLESRELLSATVAPQTSIGDATYIEAATAKVGPTSEGVTQTAAPSSTNTVQSKIQDGIVTIRGTGYADTFDITRSGNALVVQTETNANGRLLHTRKTFSYPAITRIVVDAAGGNDTVNIGSTVAAQTRVYGGVGNDVLRGGSGIDQMYGGHGTDQLFGNNGNDVLVGGQGVDTLNGGSGSNSLTQDYSARRTTHTSIEAQILSLTNGYRTRNGLRPLSSDTRLAMSAQIHTADMVRVSNKYGNSSALSHALWGAEQPTLSARADYVGFPWGRLAENIAYGYDTAAQVVNAWMASPGHRANIMNPALTHLGVGVATNAKGVKFYTQSFAALS